MSCSFELIVPMANGVLTLNGVGFRNRMEAYRCIAQELLDRGFRPPRFFGLLVQKELRSLPREILVFMEELCDD